MLDPRTRPRGESGKNKNPDVVVDEIVLPDGRRFKTADLLVQAYTTKKESVEHLRRIDNRYWQQSTNTGKKPTIEESMRIVRLWADHNYAELKKLFPYAPNRLVIDRSVNAHRTRLKYAGLIKPLAVGGGQDRKDLFFD